MERTTEAVAVVITTLLLASAAGAQSTRCAIDSTAPWAIVIPTRSMVGAKGSSAVVLVVQHSATLQERVLDLAKRAPPDQVPPSSLAMLEDRVLTNSGKQVYGTQFTMASDGLVKFAPVADARGLATRRERAGLPPLDVYVCLIEESGLRVDRSTLPP